MFTLLALLIYLLYYCTFYASFETSRFKPPSGPRYDFSPYPVSPVDLNIHPMHDGNITATVDKKYKLHHMLTDSYVVRNNTIVQKDTCQDIPDGIKIPATGRELYEYVQKKETAGPRSTPLKQQMNRVLQQGQIFYFECKNEGIDSLHVCPEGSVLLRDSCIPVDDCIDQEYNATFADRLGSDHFYQCLEQKTRRKCPPGTIFIHDSCRRPKTQDVLCENSSSSFLALDASTYIRCDEHGVAHKYHCPPGHVLFGQKCQVDWCLGKPEGARVGLPGEKFKDLFVYSPGYAVCDRAGRVSQKFKCSGDSTGNDYGQQQSEEEDLSQLPMVFDEKTGDCAPPSLCENIHPLDENTLVPSREYSSHLGSAWKYVNRFDQSIGYMCEGNVKRRVPLKDGNRVKNFTSESACDQYPYVEQVVIGDATDRYYDCAKRTEEYCPPKHFFNGNHCQRKHNRMFHFRNLEIFRMNNLSAEDDWISPWNLSDDPISPFQHPPNRLVCTEPESEYVYGFNVCSHPDCAAFGYLKQLENYVALPDGHFCVYHDGKISKSSKQVLASGYQFWNQRGRLKLWNKDDPPSVPASHDPCVFGQNIKTGHFVFDSVIFVTCDTAQPFVFCPAESTKGIVEIDGTNGKVYACTPPKPGFGFQKSGSTRQYLKKQLQRVVALKQKALLVIEEQSNIKTLELQPGEAHEIDGEEVTITTDVKLGLEFKYTATYPPNAYFEGDTPRAGSNKDIFILEKGNFTNKPVNLPKHELQDAIHEYKM